VAKVKVCDRSKPLLVTNMTNSGAKLKSNGNKTVPPCFRIFQTGNLVEVVNRQELCYGLRVKKKKKNSVACSPQANYTD
jgi:hypothetical protein